MVGYKKPCCTVVVMPPVCFIFMDFTLGFLFSLVKMACFYCSINQLLGFPNNAAFLLKSFGSFFPPSGKTKLSGLSGLV